MFRDADIAQAIQSTLAQVEPDKHAAFVVVGTPEGVRGCMMVRLSDVWQVQAIVDAGYHGSLDGGAVLKASW